MQYGPLLLIGLGAYAYGKLSDDDGFSWTKATLLSIALFGTVYLVKK